MSSRYRFLYDTHPKSVHKANNKNLDLQDNAEPPSKTSTKMSEPVKAETKTISALKPSDTPTVKSIPAKIQEPMYTKAAMPKVNKVGGDRLINKRRLDDKGSLMIMGPFVDQTLDFLQF